MIEGNLQVHQYQEPISLYENNICHLFEPSTKVRDCMSLKENSNTPLGFQTTYYTSNRTSLLCIK